VREWIHVSDNCRAITAVLEKGLSGSIYNIGTAQHIRNLDLARILLSELGLDDSSLEFVSDRPGHDQRYSISSAKIMTELGWSPQIEFEEGLRETINWYREKLAGS
jgi:dTDP-glucose 4,6-dehydratase